MSLSKADLTELERALMGLEPDTFRLEDVGLDPLPTAVHECGHAAVALLLGFRVLSVEVMIRYHGPGNPNNTAGMMDYDHRRARNCGATETALRRVATAFAGPLAEARFDGSPLELVAGDRAIARSNATKIDPRNPDNAIRTGHKLAERLLDRPENWSALLACADELAERREMTGREFRRLFIDSRHLARTEQQLAALSETLHHLHHWTTGA